MPDVRRLPLHRLGVFAFSIYAAVPLWANILARMGPLLRDRILLLQFLCITGIPGSGTVLVRGMEYIGTPLLRRDTASDIS